MEAAGYRLLNDGDVVDSQHVQIFSKRERQETYTLFLCSVPGWPVDRTYLTQADHLRLQ